MVNRRHQEDELRRAIERQRRRLECRLRAVEREGRRLRSWRTYARRFPAQYAGLAAGIGLIVGAGLRGGGSSRLGRILMGRASADLLWRAIRAGWDTVGKEDRRG